MDGRDTHPGKDYHQVTIGTEQPLEGIEPDKASHLDDVLDALADQRRRYALHYLREEKRAPLSEIAEQIAAWERDRSVGEASDDTRAEIEIALYHRHLPKLREANVTMGTPRLWRFECRPRSQSSVSSNASSGSSRHKSPTPNWMVDQLMALSVLTNTDTVDQSG